MKKQNSIPIFFSCDDRYIPFLATALRSLIDHAKQPLPYQVYILNNGLRQDNMENIRAMETDRVSIRFVDVSERVWPLMHRLDLRDYYTVSIYFRLFIPAMFPELDKAVYLDADTVLLSDIAELFFTDLRGKLLAAVPDAVIASRADFIRYAEQGVGVNYRRYFNSGVLLMDLKKLRAFDIEGRFAYLLNTYRFDTVCPDQDYLNVMCRNRVLYLDSGWNKMSIDPSPTPVIHLIHYNMFNKPWLYEDTPYGEHFWRYAKKTAYYEEIAAMRGNYTEDDRKKDKIAERQLVEKTRTIVQLPNNFKKILFDEVTEVYETEDFSLAARQA